MQASDANLHFSFVWLSCRWIKGLLQRTRQRGWRLEVAVKLILTHSELLCSIFVSSPLHLTVFVFNFFLCFLPNLNERMKKKTSHFRKASLLRLVYHLMKLEFFIEHTFGISHLCFVLICKLLQRTQMLRMFSLLARTEFIWLTVFCSDAWFLKLYSNLQSTQIYFITNIWKLDLMAIDF